jgi:hypothetical protein
MVAHCKVWSLTTLNPNLSAGPDRTKTRGDLRYVNSLTILRPSLAESRFSANVGRSVGLMIYCDIFFSQVKRA